MNVCEREVCPLTYKRTVNGNPVSGLAVTVTVRDARTGAVLLPATIAPEVGSSTGIYTYNWTHGLILETPCIATYSATGRGPIDEDVLIKFSGFPGRGV